MNSQIFKNTTHMKRTITFLLCSLPFISLLFGQTLSSAQVLDRSIQYHNPMGNWEKFADTLRIHQTSPKRPDSERVIYMNNKEGSFAYSMEKAEGVIDCYLSADTTFYLWNGGTSIPDTIQTKYKLTPARAKMYRNYYAYLYGLPMKLKDPGSILHEEVKELAFFGKATYRIKVTYTPEVGNDIWYFYFDKKTFALVAYQFYHDESKNDGEYILLEKEQNIQGVIMPKVRTWYTNDGDRVLGTDSLRE